MSNKYSASLVQVDGEKFASKLEARHYNWLKIKQMAGEIEEITLHPSFDLHVNGVKIGKALLDFKFYDKGRNIMRYADSKGLDNALSKWKRKHIEAEYGIKVEVWKKGGAIEL